MSQFVDGIEFVTEHCCECGIPFAMTRDFNNRRRNDHKTFFCPAGHSQYYSGKTEAQKLRDQLERERQMREAADARASNLQHQRNQVAKAHRKMRARVMNGVCPCCNRTFQNLMRHMQTKHAGEITLRTIREAYGMTQAAIAEEIGIGNAHISLYERDKPVPDYAREAIESWMAAQEGGQA
jgi:DNA-binding XRE family transcriptional regulator